MKPKQIPSVGNLRRGDALNLESTVARGLSISRSLRSRSTNKLLDKDKLVDLGWTKKEK